MTDQQIAAIEHSVKSALIGLGMKRLKSDEFFGTNQSTYREVQLAA